LTIIWLYRRKGTRYGYCYYTDGYDRKWSTEL